MNNITLNKQPYSPSKIICVGRNYIDHAKELNNAVPDTPVIFVKPNSAIGDQLLLPSDEKIHYETELCLFMQSNQVIGVGLGLDLTKRALQSTLKEKALPWERAKAFDGSAVFSDFIPINQISALSDLSLSLHVNDKIKQQGHVRDMIFSPHALIEDIQSFMTLFDGDIIMTGTPAGVGPIAHGDILHATLSDAQGVVLEKTWTAL